MPLVLAAPADKAGRGRHRRAREGERARSLPPKTFQGLERGGLREEEVETWAFVWGDGGERRLPPSGQLSGSGR